LIKCYKNGNISINKRWVIWISHLVIDDQIFVNARDKTDPGMEQIKKTIIQQAKHQPTWGQTLPKCFLPLELEIAALDHKGVALITMFEYFLFLHI
jgi:hypothetical protein